MILHIEDVRRSLREAIFEFGSQKTFAEKGKVSPQYVNDVLLGRREPGPRILKALKLKKVVGYTYILLLLIVACVAPVEAKEVVIPYNDFVQMLAKGEHREKLLNQCLAQKEILLQVKDEQGKIIELKGEQIKGLIEAVEAHEQLGVTEAKLTDAARMTLQTELVRERANRTWWAGGGVATGAVVMWIIMTVIN